MSLKTSEVIQKILEHLDESMDEERISIDPISHEALEISYPRWCRILSMMLSEGLIEGFHEINVSQATFPQFKARKPQITLKGIQYLSDNSNMAKLYRAAKEIKDWIT